MTTVSATIPVISSSFAPGDDIERELVGFGTTFFVPNRPFGHADDISHFLTVVAAGPHLPDPFVLGSFEQFTRIIWNPSAFGGGDVVSQPPFAGLRILVEELCLPIGDDFVWPMRSQQRSRTAIAVFAISRWLTISPVVEEPCSANTARFCVSWPSRVRSSVGEKSTNNSSRRWWWCQ